MKLEIVRGLPGSGKSTHARNSHGTSYVVEADQFFIVEQEYKYDARFIGNAHDWCFAKTIMLLRHGKDVIVANTFTRLKEMERYVALKAYFPDLEVIITELYTMYGNTHNVPPETIDKMAARWENIPGDWVQKDGIIVNRVE